MNTRKHDSWSIMREKYGPDFGRDEHEHPDSAIQDAHIARHCWGEEYDRAGVTERAKQGSE